MGKELCKIQETLIRSDLRAYVAIVDDPKHVCKRCGRVANKKKRLCKPFRIKSLKK